MGGSPVGPPLASAPLLLVPCCAGPSAGPHPLRMTCVPRGEDDRRGSSYASPPLVAIFNSRDEVIEAIRSALENDGFETVTARLAEIQNGTLDLVAFIKVHAPDVIVYDLPRPYEAHWNFLRLMKETTSLKDRMWILTRTDKEALEAAV